MIFHINRLTFKADGTEERRQECLQAARQAGADNPAVRSFAVGREHGGEYEWAAVYLVDDLEAYSAYLNHPAHLRSELTGIEQTERFQATDITDSADPGIADKIAQLQASHVAQHPELAALIARAGSFSVPGGQR